MAKVITNPFITNTIPSINLTNFTPVQDYQDDRTDYLQDELYRGANSFSF